MKRALAFAILAAGLAPAAAGAGPGDEAAIRALEQQQAAAWNAHDIDAYAALFTADADVINVLGWHWRDRAELNRKLGRAHQSIFAKSTLTIGAIDIDFMAPEIAVAHVPWTLAGAQSPTGAGGAAPKVGIQTQVLVKRDGKWRIAEFQNTNSVPERPFPPAQP